MPKNKTEKQPNLFGDIDQVYNALETERTIVVEAIESAHGKIAKLEEKITAMGERKEGLDDAIVIVAKQRKEASKDAKA